MTVLSAFLLLAAWGQASSAPDAAAAETEEARIAESLQLTRQAAERYEFAFADGKREGLELHPAPVLRWSNPARGSIHGHVFLWTHGGRPEAVGSFFKWYSPFTHGSHEFQSFSSRPLTATLGDRSVWRPARAGVEFEPIPSAPLPAESRARRLTQMRDMARQFTVQTTDRDGLANELRLLTQPIYRYQNASANRIDGALFVFVQGTDPEAFLLLEAHAGEQGRQWRYALTRMNSVQFVAAYQKREVWRAEVLLWSQVGDPREPYFSKRAEE